jgi:16S rRNA (uracil1498-N3)-methyltransferase
MIPNNAPFFFVEDCKTNSNIKLTPEESKHAIKSLRLRKNDLVKITDGKGNIYEGIIKNNNVKQVEINIVNKYTENTLPYFIHIACAITQQTERFEWFVEKAVEFGINEITPIYTKRSQKKSIKIERLNKIAISALKQSRQAYLPKINDILSFSDFVSKIKLSNKGIAYCEGNRIFLKQWIEQNTKNDYVIIVGPEGDFTYEEIQTAIDNGYTLLNLGNSILRTETAALYVTSVFRTLKQQ